MAPPKPLTFMFKDNGSVPNNPALPVLVYKGAVGVVIRQVSSKNCSPPMAGAMANGATASIRSCTTTR
ncbi:MAG TPA: hypothetical protein VEH78_05105 [Pseudolabrys sp.]|nr:hypothetical protein [Pseudolabrys sp.]